MMVQSYEKKESKMPQGVTKTYQKVTGLRINCAPFLYSTCCYRNYLYNRKEAL